MISPDTIFLKLGGSLITDKTGVAAVRADLLARLATEIASVRQARPALRLLLGHGSGSFGHVVAAQYGTRDGVQTPAQWHGFTEVARAAATLNHLVVAALQAAGVPAFSLSPSASAHCQNGQLTFMAVEPVRRALDAHILPVVYGDVAFETSTWIGARPKPVKPGISWTGFTALIYPGPYQIQSRQPEALE